MNKLINFLRINPGDTHSQVREKIEKLFERVVFVLTKREGRRWQRK